MVGMTGIDILWRNPKFMGSNRGGKVELFRKLYEESIEKDYHKEWEKNWKISKPIVESFVEMRYETTKFLLSGTDWGGVRNYSKIFYNISEVKHNPEFVQQLLSLCKIWDNDLPLSYEEYRWSDSPAIHRAIAEFCEIYPGDYSAKNTRVCEGYRYFSITEYPSRCVGSTNMNTDTCVIDAVCF